MALDKFIRILTEFRKSSLVIITENTIFQSLQLNSLCMLEIIMKIEEETGVTVSMGRSFKTVENVLNFINASKS